MDSQAKVSTNGKPAPAEPNVAQSFSGLAHDAIELAELQAQLFALDATSASREARTSLGLTIASACLLLGCVPVALLALAEVFIAKFEWSRAAAMSAAAGIGLLLSAITIAVAWYHMRHGIDALKRSRDELRRNLDWVKSNLKAVKERSRS